MRLSLPAFAAIVLVFVVVKNVKAQSDLPRIEVGVHYTFIDFNRSNQCGSCAEIRNGFGGRVTYNFNRNVAAEAILNFFPGDVFKIVVPPSSFPKPRLQGLFGLKAGIHKERFGVFGAVRPGFMRFTPVTDCRTSDFSSCRDVLKNEFTINFGGVAEAYLSRHAMVRFDIGDSYIRYPDTRFLVADTGPQGPIVGVFTKRGFNTHNLQISIGAGFRF
jgi:hypothetical protein